jgi:hypothetical protein
MQQVRRVRLDLEAGTRFRFHVLVAFVHPAPLLIETAVVWAPLFLAWTISGTRLKRSLALGKAPARMYTHLALGRASDPIDVSMKNQRDLIGAAHIEVIPDHTFKPHPPSEWPVK